MDGPDLDGQTVLVTGSARGVGRELLLATADCGAATAVHYHTSADAAREVAAQARERGAPAAMTVQGDVTDPDSSKNDPEDLVEVSLDEKGTYRLPQDCLRIISPV